MKKIIERVEQLIQQGNSVLSTQKKNGVFDFVDFGEMKGFRSAVLSFIERIYGKNHTYYNEFNSVVSSESHSDVEAGLSMLNSIRDEISGGYLFTLKGLFTAEIFSDFLEMSKYLLNQGYKDPAAVMIGSVLEEHLRQLAIKNEIPTEIEKDDKLIIKKADRLNSDLSKEEVYSKLDQKAIIAWLDLRNKAAHGKYEEYTKEQVSLMLHGVIDFLTRTPL